MIKINNILVATDFGTASETALTYGRQLARNFGARLHVMHVVENALLWAGVDSGGVDLTMLQAQLQESARDKLRSLLTDEDRRELRAVTAIRTQNNPAFAIVEYAKSENMDLIVIGTHGRGAMAHLLMGSVAEKLVRIAPCPVLTVRSPEHEFVLPDALERVSHAGR
jgi:nucleotide-binding universal stress UspA family protein